MAVQLLARGKRPNTRVSYVWWTRIRKCHACFNDRTYEQYSQHLFNTGWETFSGSADKNGFFERLSDTYEKRTKTIPVTLDDQLLDRTKDFASDFGINHNDFIAVIIGIGYNESCI